MQRIDPSQPQPQRIMLVLDKARHEFVLKRSYETFMSPTEWLRSIAVKKTIETTQLKEVERKGLKDKRFNLVLPDPCVENILSFCAANKISKASYMRILIDQEMEISCAK